MATANREISVQHRIAQYLLIDPLNEGRNLAHRFQEGEAFRRHVRKRRRLVIPVAAVMALSSVGCAVGTVAFLAGAGSVAALLGFILAPFVLIGSLFVQAYVFFSWIEGRALARIVKNPAARPKFPPVPWGLAALFVFLPLYLLAVVGIKMALALISLQILAPILYARLDR